MFALDLFYCIHPILLVNFMDKYMYTNSPVYTVTRCLHRLSMMMSWSIVYNHVYHNHSDLARTRASPTSTTTCLSRYVSLSVSRASPVPRRCPASRKASFPRSKMSSNRMYKVGQTEVKTSVLALVSTR